jgi:hypothetical protein
MWAFYFRGDARRPTRFRGNVLILDVLHYFSDSDQEAMLVNAARAVGEGALLLIRDGISDGSWRYRFTYAQERFSKAIGWLRGEVLNFPSIDTLTSIAVEEGLKLIEVKRLWKGNPFNNQLLVFSRA